MNRLTMNEFSKKMELIYLVVYVIKNELDIKKTNI